MTRLPLLAGLLATAATAGAPERPSLATAEADLAGAHTRAATLDRRRRAQAEALAEANLPTTRLLAMLQRIAVRPPVVALLQPGSIDDTLRARTMLAAITPAIAARTAGLRDDMAATAAAHATALADEDDARRRLAATIASLRAPRPLVDLAALYRLPAPPLRAPLATATGQPAYRLPATGKILIGTGEPLAEGGRARGLTLAPAPHAPVIAPTAARIAYAGRFGSYGAILILDHGHGWTTLLAGLADSAVKPGALVTAGAPLGRMPATDPRLTIELRHDGRIVDVAAMAAWRG